MVTLIQREFAVGVRMHKEWEHFARVEQWPSWAPHFKRIELEPPGQLGPQSTGVLHLADGVTPAFRVTEFNLLRNWKWVGKFLWLGVIYDHQFEQLSAGHPKLTFIVQAMGFGASVLGPLFAKFYRGSLEKAIPMLVPEMNASSASV